MRYTKTTFENCATALLRCKNVAIFAHTHPDGDAIGSAVALKLALKAKNIASSVFCDSDLPYALQKIGFSQYVDREYHGQYDMLVAVDCGDVFRVGDYYTVYAKHANTMTIDHHCGDLYSKYNYVEKRASTAQLIYDVITSMGVALNDTIANCLYIGICTDTGNFQFSNTDSDAFAFASKLLKHQIDVEEISRCFYKDISYNQSRFIGERILNMKSYLNGELVVIFAMKTDWEKYELTALATDGLVQYAADVEDCKVAVAVSEYCDNVYKISMRGKGVKVKGICEQFGGGGHDYAAGCQLSGFFEDVIDKLVRTISFEL